MMPKNCLRPRLRLMRRSGLPDCKRCEMSGSYFQYGYIFSIEDRMSRSLQTARVSGSRHRHDYMPLVFSAE